MFQAAVGGARARRAFVADHLKARRGDRVLDIGCGPSDILEDLGDVDYVGIDLSPDYIEAARARYGGRGTFRVGSAEELKGDPDGPFDIAMAVGLLHHLDDKVVAGLFETVSSLLKDGGRFVTVDPTFAEGQSPLARRIIQSDRGRNVRTEEELRRIAEPRFSTVVSVVRHDLLRIPYSHVVLDCRR
jgi:SAM-dependent methyltransferase